MDTPPYTAVRHHTVRLNATTPKRFVLWHPKIRTASLPSGIHDAAGCANNVFLKAVEPPLLPARPQTAIVVK